MWVKYIYKVEEPLEITIFNMIMALIIVYITYYTVPKIVHKLEDIIGQEQQSKLIQGRLNMWVLFMLLSLAVEPFLGSILIDKFYLKKETVLPGNKIVITKITAIHYSRVFLDES